MADGFDKAKASTDLKHILKMNQIPQDTMVSLKKEKTKRAEDARTADGSYGTQHSQRSKYSGRSSNSNGNALLESTDASWPDVVPQNQRGRTNFNGNQSVPKRNKNGRGINNARRSENESTSLPSFQKTKSETLEFREAVYSNKQSLGMKSRKNSVESDFMKNSEDDVNTARKGGNKNMSPVKNQRRNNKPFRNGDEETENIRKVKNHDSSRNERRGDRSDSQRSDGRNRVEMDAESQNNSANNIKPYPVEPEEEELTKEFLLLLGENKIQLLKKKNLRFPKARYYCDLCDYHIDSSRDCDKHLKDYRHSRRKKLDEEYTVLRSIPEPTDCQFAALTAAVEKIYKEHGISMREMELRAEVVLRLENALKEKIPDVVIFMYGSSLTGFGLKTADINVDLTSASKDKQLTFLLKEAYLSMKDKTDLGFSNVRSDFTAKVPGLILTDDLTGLTVSVAIHCYNARCSSELLSIYSDFDIRVRKLVVAFRYWAHLCGLDRHCDGFIPPQALNLMVIYFLQTVNPQLVPIILPPKVSGDDIRDYRKDTAAFEKMRAKVMKVNMKSLNNMSIGELWFRLLWFYCLDFDTPNVVVCIHSSQEVPRNSKPWNSKKLAVEDPYMLKKNVTRMVNNTRVYEYWEDSIIKALYYFGFPRDTEGKSHIPVEALKEMKQRSETAEERLLTMTDEKQHEVERQSATGNKEKSALAEESNGKRNLSPEKEEDSASVFTASDPLASHKAVLPNKEGQTQSSSEESKSSSDSESVDTEDSYSDDSDFDDVTEQQVPLISSDCAVCKRKENTNVEYGKGCSHCNQSYSESYDHQEVADDDLVNMRGLPSSAFKSDSVDSAESDPDAAAKHADHCENRSSQSSSYLSAEEVTEGTGDKMDLTKEQKDIFSFIAQKDCFYEFSKEFLTDGKGPVLVCTYCEKEGHLKNACPEDKLPEILPLPNLTPLHINVLSETLSKVPSIVGLNAFGLAWRMNFMNNLEEFIQVQFKDANLALFGSSCNGFGFDQSDMDLCLTFSQRKVTDKPWVIESLARQLKQNKELVNVQAICTAKVPIVKFTVKSMGLEGDISLYNILAQHNTKLLLCYSQIDPRVRILGYAIKNFAKVCDIGDASRGSLSSYAYILMMIYYLQQVTPPVVPVLQELYEGKEKPKLMIEGCDAWFMDDLSKLDNLWPEKGKNKMSIAELWLGFLCFYVEEFNYRELVVSIRQKEPLTRFEKLWNGENIAVEDPFDVSHNLGSGLTRKMNNFIFKTFINGRMLYGSPIDDNMEMFQRYRIPYDYFFDTDLLSECRPPNVRGCRHCGKMGHLARHCPAARKDKEDQKRLEKQQKQLQQQKKQQPPSQQNLAPSSQQQPPSQQKQAPSAQQQPSQQKQIAQQPPSQQKQAPSGQQQPPSQQKQVAQQPPSQQKQVAQQPPSQQKQVAQQPPSQQKQAPSGQQQPPSQQKQVAQQPPSQQKQVAQQPPSQQKQVTQHLPSQHKQATSSQQLPPSQQKQVVQQPPSQQRQAHSPLQQSSSQQKQAPAQQHKQIQPLLSQPDKQQQRYSTQPQQQSHSSQPQQQQKQSLQPHQQSQPFQQRQPSQKPQQQKQSQPSQQQQQEERQFVQPKQQQSLPLQSQQHPRPPLQQQQQNHPYEQQEQRQSPQIQQQRQQQLQRPPSQPEQLGRQSSHTQQLQRPPSQPEQLGRQSSQTQELQRPPSQPEQLGRQSSQTQPLQRPPFQPEQLGRQSSQTQQLQRPPSQPEQLGRQSSQTQQLQRPPSQPEQLGRQSSQTQQLQRPPSQPEQLGRQSSQTQQLQRPPSQPEQLGRQPSHTQQKQSFQTQHLVTQPQQRRPSAEQLEQPSQLHQQHRQSPQPQQQQRQPSQSQLQQQNQPFQQPQLQQQQPVEREIYDSRQERDQWHSGPAGNMNINSSAGPGLHYNFVDHQGIQAAVPSQVYLNSNYKQHHHHQQHLHRGYMPSNLVLPPPGFPPHPLMTLPRYGFPSFARPPPFHPGMMFQSGYPQASHNLGSGHFDNRGPQSAPGAQRSGQGGGVNNANGQFMSPAVQSMFDSANGQIVKY